MIVCRPERRSHSPKIVKRGSIGLANTNAHVSIPLFNSSAATAGSNGVPIGSESDGGSSGHKCSAAHAQRRTARHHFRILAGTHTHRRARTSKTAVMAQTHGVPEFKLCNRLKWTQTCNSLIFWDWIWMSERDGIIQSLARALRTLTPNYDAIKSQFPIRSHSFDSPASYFLCASASRIYFFIKSGV